MHQIKGMISCKKMGQLGDRSEKGVIGCEIAKSGQFEHIFFELAICIILMISLKILIEKTKMAGGSLGVIL